MLWALQASVVEWIHISVKIFTIRGDILMVESLSAAGIPKNRGMTSLGNVVQYCIDTPWSLAWTRVEAEVLNSQCWLMIDCPTIAPQFTISRRTLACSFLTFITLQSDTMCSRIASRNRWHFCIAHVNDGHWIAHLVRSAPSLCTWWPCDALFFICSDTLPITT